jgi:hypothetical protein
MYMYYFSIKKRNHFNISYTIRIHVNPLTRTILTKKQVDVEEKNIFHKHITFFIL